MTNRLQNSWYKIQRVGHILNGNVCFTEKKIAEILQSLMIIIDIVTIELMERKKEKIIVIQNL